MNIFYYIIHTFTGCPDESLEWFKNKKSTCKKCGRVTYHFYKSI
jgi:hypothetical protein